MVTFPAAAFYLAAGSCACIAAQDCGTKSRGTYLVLEETQPVLESLEMYEFQLQVHVTTQSVFAHTSFLWFPECHVPRFSLIARSCDSISYQYLSAFKL